MKSVGLRRASTLAIQFFGNILKGVFYLDILLRPSMRYTLPAVAKPWRHSASAGIPRIFWLTNYTNKVTLSIYVNYLFNRLMAPTFEFRFCGDEECDRFIRENFSPEIHDCYSRLQIGAAKADLWRVLVLFVHGGVYMDIDAALSWSPESFLSADQSELIIRTKDGKLTNYFFASVPGNPFFRKIADRIVENIVAGTITSVYDMTGPTVVDAVAEGISVHVEPHEIVCRQGQFTKKSFQYPDNRKGYWGLEQTRKDIVKKDLPS
ncbi:MAG: mannosyltransferase [Alphaproteobacteria bacterium]|nr:mannosyltransferase [Alphaproteobacteria bacterium]